VVRTGRAGLLRHPYLLHLRLGFNLLLSPIYLWGAFLGGGGLGDPRFWFGYVSLHLFLYGGTTAFNSFYDEDDGPIGGMLRPPPVDPGLLRFSLVVQALGLLPAAASGPVFLLAWLALFTVFAAYSHPLTRLKARPAAALAAIALGQGAIGFALGWLAVALPAGLLSRTGLVGMTSAALVVTGLYVITQSYQAEADRARGDITLAVQLGAGTSLLLAGLPLAVGGGLVVWWVGLMLGWARAAVLAAFFAVLAAWLIRWALGFAEAEVERNFHVAMRFVTAASVGLASFLLLHLA
jgi:4-hydroxybenzoate polyprenyltransferase